MTTFYNNYVSLCAARKKSLSAVAQEIGLSRTSPNGWKKGKQPSAVTLEKLAQYFNVPVADLTNEQQKKPADQKAGELSPVKLKLLEYVKQMPDADLEKLEMLIKIVESK